ncbi:hypothetical protein [Micromonospora sp. NPDC049679]|uniref:hypothetical protein n=1 Tax=Micromonospora sp. NPDC049679 TaxID=3155920 RepID=UPI0033CCFA76
MATGAAGCFGYIVGLFAMWATAGRDADPSALSVSFVLAAMLALVAAVGAGLAIAFVSRAGAWLEGTFLTVRNLTTRTVNLALARSVTLRAISDTQAAVPSDGGVVLTGVAVRTPLLTVVAGGTTVRLRLRSRDGTLLPPAQMLVLADALAVARCPAAAEAVAWLRTMAADPRTLLL